VGNGDVSGSYFLAMSEFLVDEEEVLDELVEHRAWSKAGYDEGIILFSGTLDPPEGGMICFRAESAEAAAAFIASDPFAVSGVAKYTLIKFTPTTFPWRSKAFAAFDAMDRVAG